MERKMVKVMHVLDKAGCACPLGYISLHTNIVEPLPVMEALEREGYVCRCGWDNWSASKYPMFEITPRAREELRQMESDALRVPLTILAQTLVQEQRK